MYTNYFNSVFLFSFLLLSLACTKRETETLSSVNISSYEIVVEDSVIVDYIGVLGWSHISPDGAHFLAMNLQNSEILLIDQVGNILQTYQFTGDQPDAIGSNPIARPQFRNSESFAVLGINGFFQFDFAGKLLGKFKPDFTPAMGYQVFHADLFQFRNENEALAQVGSRNQKGSGFYSIDAGTILEKINIQNNTFTGVVPYPSNSRFSKSDEIYTQTSTYPVMRVQGSGVYVAFTNDPTLYFYKWSDLEHPAKEIALKFDAFEQIKGKDPKAIDLDVISFDTRTFAYGSINHMHSYQNQPLIGYESGLTDEAYARAIEGVNGFQEIFQAINKVQVAKWALVSEDGGLIPIEIPKELGRIEFIDSENNIWISPNKSERERDYEALFKARLRAKP
ncbi:hypothetical protein [Mongoliitalea daihaiensis]|uniref:hypothetical protein n=1 Tax=Mongoliitalea daihaiensis TaxID=2782006 RepID=UPI001F31967D|nr:hypothetical protein [Mongoliitalea daihaiensis]UJP66758.1 hypothetical protein IPZ59_09300 [Mongoliitalea daihaiensis]